MKSIRMTTIAALLMAGSSAMAGNADIVVSGVAAGGQTELQFDMLNDGGATAFQFNLKMAGPVGDLKVESGNCLSGLPSTHTGACNYANGVLKVAVISPSNAVLSSGPIGSVTISAPLSAMKVSLEGLLVGDPSGNPVQADGIVDIAGHRENFEK